MNQQREGLTAEEKVWEIRDQTLFQIWRATARIDVRLHGQREALTVVVVFSLLGALFGLGGLVVALLGVAP